MDALKDIFINTISFIFGWLPKIYDYVLIQYIPKWYETIFALVMIVVIVSIIAWVIRSLANKIIIIALLIVMFPALISTLNGLNIPGLSNILNPVVDILKWK